MYSSHTAKKKEIYLCVTGRTYQMSCGRLTWSGRSWVCRLSVCAERPALGCDRPRPCQVQQPLPSPGRHRHPETPTGHERTVGHYYKWATQINASTMIRFHMHFFYMRHYKWATQINASTMIRFHMHFFLHAPLQMSHSNQCFNHDTFSHALFYMRHYKWATQINASTMIQRFHMHFFLDAPLQYHA